MKTPSNCTETCLSFNVAGVVKCFRYHPIPEGRKPPDPVVEFVSANGPSMDQSCGTSSTRQPLSSNPGSCARVGSLRVNDQFKSMERRWRGPPAPLSAREDSVARTKREMTLAQGCFDAFFGPVRPVSPGCEDTASVVSRVPPSILTRSAWIRMAKVVRHSRRLYSRWRKWRSRESCSRQFWKGLGG